MTQDRPPQYKPWVKPPSQTERPDFSAVLAKIKDALTKDYGGVDWWKRRVEGTPLENDVPVRAATVALELLTNENTRAKSAPPEGEPDFKVIAKDILSKLHLRIRSAMGKGPIKEYPPSDGAVTLVEGKLCEAYHLGQASHHAPPEGEPDLTEAWDKLQPPTKRVGLAARPKVEDVDVLRGQLAEITVDRDEWKQQHENLVSVRETDIANLAAKIDGLKAELDRRKGDACTRLHNLCEAHQEDLDKSPYTLEEWEQVDQEIVELQRKLREAKAELAKREAELAEADECLAWLDEAAQDDLVMPPPDQFEEWNQKALARHAARQQQKD